MTDNFPRVRKVLDRIPDAATRWPGWNSPVCGICGKGCEQDSNGEWFCWSHDADSIVPRFGPPTDGQGADVWHGGDLDPRNMHHLWAMLEAVDACGLPEISFSMGEHTASVNFKEGQSPNIIEAMLRCLEEAVK